MTIILMFGVAVHSLLWWNMVSYSVVDSPVVLNNRERRKVKRFYSKKKNRKKSLVLDERLDESMSPKDYGMSTRNRKWKN